MNKQAKKVCINGTTHGLRTLNTELGNLDVLFHATLADDGDAKITKESLQHLNHIHCSVAYWACSSVAAIGNLMTLVDHDELSQGDMLSLGWLIAGLGELQEALADAKAILDMKNTGQ